MTTPPYPDPNQQPDPSQYQPPSGASYGVSDQPGGYPPSDPNAYPPQSGGTYPPPDPNAYPPPDPNAYPPSGGTYPPPGQPGGTYPPPGTPGEPPAKAKNNGRSRIIMAVVAVVIVVLGIVLYWVNRQSNPDYAKAGDCIQYNSDTDVNVVDCTSSDAQYKVVKRVDGTSSSTACDNVTDADVSLFTKSGSDKQYTLCVSLVLSKGDCVTGDGDRVACTDAKAEEKVIGVLTGTQDENKCPAAADSYLKHKADNQVICLGPVS